MAPDPARDGYLQLLEDRADIAGRYLKPERVGGTGGDGHFSLVLSATDSDTRKRVAIKVFRPDRLTDTYRFQSFCREEVLLERLVGTPHILEWIGKRDQLVELVRSSGGIPFTLQFPYFVVELAKTDVGSILRSRTWSPTEKLLAFKQMCKAVQRIHLAGIVHRDIKPSNFLVMDDGAVKLSDFGTARLIDGTEPPLLANYRAAPGDLRYSAPEMHALLQNIDPAISRNADIFALGATLFELYTGTILGLKVFDSDFGLGLAQVMGAMNRRDALRVYLGFVQSLDSGHPLPSISAYHGDAPGSIRGLLDSLYKAMAAMDFRRRLCDFTRIFLKIDQCLLVLNNEEKVRRWKHQREIFRQKRLEKLQRRQARSRPPI